MEDFSTTNEAEEHPRIKRLLAQLNRLAASATVEYTGGGCWHLEIVLPNGEILIANNGDELELATKPRERWYTTHAASRAEHEEGSPNDPAEYGSRLTDAALVALARRYARNQHPAVAAPPFPQRPGLGDEVRFVVDGVMRRGEVTALRAARGGHSLVVHAPGHVWRDVPMRDVDWVLRAAAESTGGKRRQRDVGALAGAVRKLTR